MVVFCCCCLLLLLFFYSLLFFPFLLLQVSFSCFCFSFSCCTLLSSSSSPLLRNMNKQLSEAFEPIELAIQEIQMVQKLQNTKKKKWTTKRNTHTKKSKQNLNESTKPQSKLSRADVGSFNSHCFIRSLPPIRSMSQWSLIKHQSETARRNEPKGNGSEWGTLWSKFPSRFDTRDSVVRSGVNEANFEPVITQWEVPRSFESSLVGFVAHSLFLLRS